MIAGYITRAAGQMLTGSHRSNYLLPQSLVLWQLFSWADIQYLEISYHGRVLENNGVIPDIKVALGREQLLQGSDSQLEAVIEYLAGQDSGSNHQ